VAIRAKSSFVTRTGLRSRSARPQSPHTCATATASGPADTRRVPGPATCSPSPPRVWGRAGHDSGLVFGVAEGFSRSLQLFPRRLIFFEDAVNGCR
jgi:hypothetical protein